MTSPFDQDLVGAIGELMDIHGESITITRPAAVEYDTETGGAKESEEEAETIEAEGIVEDVAESETDGLRIAGSIKITTLTEVIDGDTVTIRGMDYRARNVKTSSSGVYEFEAVR